MCVCVGGGGGVVGGIAYKSMGRRLMPDVCGSHGMRQLMCSRNGDVLRLSSLAHHLVPRL